MTEGSKERLPTQPGSAQRARQLARKPSIGLALGGGGARGFAHILMLEALDELDIKPSVIAGTSIGAIFGLAYASGYSAAQIRAHTEELLSSRYEILRQFFMARQKPLGRVFSIMQLRSALFNPEGLLDLILPTRIGRDFAELGIPFKAVAADFHTQEQVVLSSGPTRPAVAASMALPALFAPVVTQECALMDGGLVNPLPFDVLSGQADIVVAINVTGGGRLPDDLSPPKATEALIGSLQILQNTIVKEKLLSRQPDILVNVDVGRFHALEFHKLGQVLEAAKPAKEELRLKLQRVLSAETIDPVEIVSQPLQEPEGQKRARLAQRLLEQKPR